MTRMYVFLGLAWSFSYLRTGFGLRRDESRDSTWSDEHESAIVDSGEQELASVDSDESAQKLESVDSKQRGAQELQNGSPYAIELEQFEMMKKLRKQGFKCPGGKRFKGVPDAESTFKFDCRLWRAAQLWSRKMGEEKFVGHYRGGTNYVTRANAQGYYGLVLENVAAGMNTPGGALKSWKASDGHCTAMMNATYDNFAVGYAYVPRSPYKHYWTLMVGSLMNGSVDRSCLKGPPTPLPKGASRGGGGGGWGGGGGGGGGGNGGKVYAAAACFPPSAKVQVDPRRGSLGIERPLSELSPGDKLLGQHDEPNTYLLDFHLDANGREIMPTSYLRIEHELQKTDRPLIITANHLVVVSNRPNGRQVSVPAGLLHPEKHALLVSVSVDGERGAKVVPSLIKSVDTVVLPGFAAPLSSSGTLFVEGVLVSSYALLSDKQLALWQRGPSFLRDHAQLICHILAMPFRWASVAGYGANYLSLLSGFFDGISSSLLLLSSNAASVLPL